MRKHRNRNGQNLDYKTKSLQTPKNVLNPTDTNGQKNDVRADAIVNRIIQQFVSRYRVNIDEWRAAIKMAEDPFFPKRDKWGQIMRDLVLDAHWTSQVSVRKLATMSKKKKIINKATGEEIPEKSALYNAPWFQYVLDVYLDAEFYGTQVIEIEDLLKGNLLPTAVYKIPVRNIIPEKQQVLLNSNMQVGIYYGDDPFIVEVREKTFMGLLSKAANLLIWKKNALQSWSEFSERFGIPMRYAKTNKRDQQSIDRIEKALFSLGSAAQAVLPDGTEINFNQPNTTDAFEVFDKQIERCNTELSKLLNGVTMLSDNGSSKSQSQIHMDVNKQFIESDMQGFESWVNFTLNPKLKALGWDVDPMKEEFCFDRTESLSPLDQSTIADMLLNHFDLDPKELTEKFGFKILDKKESNPPPQPTPPSNDDEKQKNQIEEIVKNQLNMVIAKMGIENFKRGQSQAANPSKKGAVDRAFSMAAYNQMLKGANRKSLPKNVGSTINELFLAAAKAFFENPSNKPSTLNEATWQALYKYVADKMFDGVEDGYGKTLTAPDLSSDDEDMLKALRENMFIFSAFKDFQLLKSMNDALKDDDGKLREWNDFKTVALKLNDDYNIAWLETEYNTAVASAQSAARWQTFWAQKADYNLKWQGIMDKRERDSHKELEGKVFAVDDPAVLGGLMPPIDWNCRCEFIQVAVDDEPLSNRSSINIPNMPAVFKHNVGVSKQIFTDDHPYWSGVSGKDAQALKDFANKHLK